MLIRFSRCGRGERILMMIHSSFKHHNKFTTTLTSAVWSAASAFSCCPKIAEIYCIKKRARELFGLDYREYYDDKRMKPQKQVIGIVLRDYPRISQTFIVHEILLLEELGVRFAHFRTEQSAGDCNSSKCFSSKCKRDLCRRFHEEVFFQDSENQFARIVAHTKFVLAITQIFFCK